MFNMFKTKNPSLDNQIVIKIFTEGLDKDTYARKSLEAFRKGIEKAGDFSKVVRGLEYEECDIAVIFGDVRDAPAKKKRMRLKAEIIGRHRGKGLIVIDTPVLMRPYDVKDEYRRIGIDSLFADTGKFNNKNCSNDRWSQLSNTFNISINKDTHMGENVYILLQRFFDASLKGSQKFRPQKYFEWLSKVIDELSVETSKKIVIRPHPGSLNNENELKLIEKFKNSILNKNIIFDYKEKKLFDVLNDAFVTITYNSGSAIDSLLYGVPNITYDSGSHAYNITPNDCKNIDSIVMPDINQWLQNLSYVDWSLEDMKNGISWIHLKKEVFNDI
jgi:hypothetical protein